LRNFLAFVFILIGALLTFPASLALWEQRVLMNEERFVALGKEVLQRDAVQDALTDRVAAEGEAIEPRVPAPAQRVVASNIVRRLPESQIGAEALRRIYEVVHRLISEDGAVQPEGEVIVLDLHPVVENVASDINQQLPRAQRVEVPPSAGRIVLVQEPDVAFAFRVARWFDGIAWYLVALPLVAFGIALLVASNRPLALMGAGMLVALTDLLRIYLVHGPVETQLIDAALLVPSAREAGRETYDAIANTFVKQEWWVVIGGIAAAIFGLVLLPIRAVLGASRE
jgi:hypothetical protein